MPLAQEPRISNTSFWESILVKATEQNDKLNRAVIVSVVLHFVLIALLIWGSLQENVDMNSAGGGGEGSVVGAVMVDPGAVVEQYNRQQQQSNDAQRAEKQRQKKRNNKPKNFSRSKRRSNSA